MKKLNILTAFSAALALASPAYAANVTLTFTGTVHEELLDFEEDQPVSYSFVINDASFQHGEFSNTEVNFFDETLSTDVDLWSSISGTGLTGAWARPSGNEDAPYSYLRYRSDGLLTLSASADSGTNGLSANGYDLYIIKFAVVLSGFSPVSLNSTDNACTYLSDYLGTYAVSSAFYLDNFMQESEYGESAYFDITSVTISSVPEPAECAAAAGLGVLALAVAARRRRKA